MKQFIYAYHGGMEGKSEVECAIHMAKWHAWVESLGQALIQPGTPVSKSKTVSSMGVTNDGGPNPLSGYSIVQAESFDQAVEMAKSCPHIEFGTMEVAELLQM